MNAQEFGEAIDLARAKVRAKVEEEALISFKEVLYNAPVPADLFAKAIVDAIRDGKIKHVSLNY